MIDSMDKTIKILISLIILLTSFCLFSNCTVVDALLGSSNQPEKQQDVSTAQSNGEEEDFQLEMLDDPMKKSQQQTQKTVEALQTAYTGKAIAVPSPQFKNAAAGDSWIPQFLQDSLTGHFAACSGMTVLDRKNEQVVIAEQKLSESGFYSDENAAAFGQMTNAEYVLTGTVQKLSRSYALAFRINHIASNEVKAAFNGQYSLIDIENGIAAKDAAVTLCKGLGISLSHAQIAAMTANRSQTLGTQRLAQGMAAEKNSDFITAAAFLAEANAQGNRESKIVMTEMLTVSPPVSVRERAAYYQLQIAKWNKIWKDLNKYMETAFPIIVYDFSQKNEDVDRYGKVSFRYKDAIRLVPNRTAVVVYNIVRNEWEKIKKNSENDKWTSGISTPWLYLPHYDIKIGLYNKYDELLARFTASFSFRGEELNVYNQTVAPQFRLFNTAKTKEIWFNMKIDEKFTEDFIKPYFIEILMSRGYGTEQVINNIPVLSLEEWYASPYADRSW